MMSKRVKKKTAYSRGDFMPIIIDLVNQALKKPLDSRARTGTPTQRLTYWQKRAEEFETALQVVITVDRTATRLIRRKRRIALARFGGTRG